jgi:hypothetical protein
VSHNLFKPSFSKNGYQQNYLNQDYALMSIKSDTRPNGGYCKKEQMLSKTAQTKKEIKPF